MDLEVASEFVTMAAHLMYIKTRMLLSIEDEEAQSEMDELIRSLEERQRSECYLKIKQLTQKLGPMSEFGRSILTRTPEPMERGKVYEYSQDPADLVIALQEMLDRRGQSDEPNLQAFDESRTPWRRNPRRFSTGSGAAASRDFCCSSAAAAPAASSSPRSWPCWSCARTI